MKSEATAWYEPGDSVGQDQPIRPVLLALYGAAIFAAITISLVSMVGGSAVLMSVFAAILFAAITIALVGIVTSQPVF